MPRVSLHESDVEEAALSWFGSLGYEVRHAPEIAPEDAWENAGRLIVTCPPQV